MALKTDPSLVIVPTAGRKPMDIDPTSFALEPHLQVISLVSCQVEYFHFIYSVICQNLTVSGCTIQHYGSLIYPNDVNCLKIDDVWRKSL